MAISTPKKVKAIALLSGGLDSTLAIQLICDQGIEVLAVNFFSPFCTCNRPGRCEAREVSEKLDVPLKRIGLGREYIEMIKSPRHGYGKNMNPCLDCRIMTFTKAKELMEEMGADFVFTGEVLGQRPMSQRRDAMRIVERDSGLEGRLLRPLSAKLMKPTIPEQKGQVDRDKLLDIQGRSRKPQIDLAEQFGIVDYPCPAGGCLLTDKGFADRLRDLFAHSEDSMHDIHLIKVGRHFRLPSGHKVIAGRNEEENDKLSALVKDEDLKCSAADYGSPLVVLRKSRSKEDLEQAAAICARYSSGRHLTRIAVNCWLDSGEPAERLEVAPMSDRLLQKYRI
jgi:tRNA U34 2-thiouridine synthase MnmA/TrmU